MAFDWKGLIGNVAPTVATAIGGPASGMAVKMLTDALGLKSSSTDEQIYNAIQMNPDALVNLKKAELDFKAHLADNDVKLAQIAAGDTQDARSRYIKMQDAAPGIIATVVMGGFFILIGMFAFADVKNVNILTLLLGALGAGFSQIIQFYFGSSSGSKKKTEIIGAMGGNGNERS